MSPHRPARRRLTTGLLAAAALLALPGSAAAASMSIAAPASVIEGGTVQFDVKATLETAVYVEVKIKPGPGCAPSAGEDSGELVLDRSAIESQFAATAVRAFPTAGSYTVCGWAKDTTAPGQPVVTSATATIAVRAPSLKIAIDVPAAVAIDDLFTVTTTTTAETERAAYAGIVPDTGAGCPATYGELQKAKGAVPVLSQSGLVTTGGPTATKEQISLPTVGKYLACAYFHYGSVASAPQATAKDSFAVAKPCVIPNLKGKTLAAAKKSLTKAGCRMGKAKKAASKTVKKNRIVRTGKKAGTVLAPNTAIGVVVSKGK